MRLNALNILNYGVRISIVLIGVMFVCDLVTPIPNDIAFTRYIGAALIAFGLYRIVLYYFKSRKREEY